MDLSVRRETAPGVGRRWRFNVDVVSERPRSLYRLERDVTLDRPLPAGLRLRTIVDGDDGVLANLMERAHAGTVGEQLGGNSDGTVEIAQWRAESALPEISVAVVDADDTVVAASMCSGTVEGEVWIVYVITEPAWTGRGLATAAVAESTLAYPSAFERLCPRRRDRRQRSVRTAAGFGRLRARRSGLSRVDLTSRAPDVRGITYQRTRPTHRTDTPNTGELAVATRPEQHGCVAGESAPEQRLI
jgi:hypothetical protein